MEIFKKNKDPKNGKKKKKKLNEKQRFFSNIISTILIFMIIATLYSITTEQKSKFEEVSISQMATDIKSGLVLDISVEGEKLIATYKDETEKKIKEGSRGISL